MHVKVDSKLCGVYDFSSQYLCSGLPMLSQLIIINDLVAIARDEMCPAAMYFKIHRDEK